MPVNLLQNNCQILLRTCLVLLLIAPAIRAEENVQLSGVSLEILNSQGGTAVAAFETELPAGEDNLILPALFQGDIQTTSLAATFNGNQVEILSGLQVALDSGKEAYFEDFNYLLLDVSSYQGQSGEVLIEMVSLAEAELFVIQSGAEAGIQRSGIMNLILLKTAMDKNTGTVGNTGCPVYAETVNTLPEYPDRVRNTIVGDQELVYELPMDVALGRLLTTAVAGSGNEIREMIITECPGSSEPLDTYCNQISPEVVELRFSDTPKTGYCHLSGSSNNHYYLTVRYLDCAGSCTYWPQYQPFPVDP